MMLNEKSKEHESLCIISIHPIAVKIFSLDQPNHCMFLGHSPCKSMLHLVISPPPPSRSAMSSPSSACVLTPPLVVMVTSLLPTSQVILRPPAKRNSAMGDLKGQKKVRFMTATASFTIVKCQPTHKHTDLKKKKKSLPTSWAGRRSLKRHIVPSCLDRFP